MGNPGKGQELKHVPLVQLAEPRVVLHDRDGKGAVTSKCNAALDVLVGIHHELKEASEQHI